MADERLITLDPVDATPSTVVLRPLPLKDRVALAICYLIPVTGVVGAAPPGTYPSEADVRDGIYYGPTGVEYEGDLIPGGGGLTPGSLLFDVDNGEPWQYMSSPLIRRPG